MCESAMHNHSGYPCFLKVLLMVITTGSFEALASYEAGNEVLSKISYKAKKGDGQVVVGDRGRVLEVQSSSSKIHVICKFPRFASIKMKADDIALVGKSILDGWKVGDRMVSGISFDDGEYGFLKKGDLGIVLGEWDNTRIHCSFQSLRRKVTMRPSDIHVKMLAKPKELLWAAVTAMLGAPALLAIYQCIPSLRLKLPGGYKEGDMVVSQHQETPLGLKVGDVGIVVGRSKIDPDARILVCFGAKTNINILITQVSKKGDHARGPYRIGDVVVSNILDGKVALRNGQILEHGQVGRVLKNAQGQEDRITCVFQGGQVVDVLLSEIVSKRCSAQERNTVVKTSHQIRKQQRQLQKEVLEARHSQEQYMHEEEVAEAFVCNMCDDLLSEPVTLICGHTLCKGCVEAWRTVCGQPFRTPCCNRVLPCQFSVRSKMSKDIEELYPRRLAERCAMSLMHGAKEDSIIANTSQPHND